MSQIGVKVLVLLSPIALCTAAGPASRRAASKPVKAAMENISGSELTKALPSSLRGFRASNASPLLGLGDE